MTFSDKVKILRRQELDAFIVQAFSPELMNAQYLQDLQVINNNSSLINNKITIDLYCIFF